MKRLALITLFYFISISVNAQTVEENKLTDSIPMINGKYEYQEVVKVDSSFKQSDLYKNGKVYFVNVYNSAKDVIQYDEKSEGQIIGKGLFKISDTWNAFLTASVFTWEVNYTTEITCKDGKYRYRFYNISIIQTASGSAGHYDLALADAFKYTEKGATKKLYRRLLNKTMAEFRSNQIQLKNYMIKKGASNTSADF